MLSSTHTESVSAARLEVPTAWWAGWSRAARAHGDALSYFAAAAYLYRTEDRIERLRRAAHGTTMVGAPAFPRASQSVPTATIFHSREMRKKGDDATFPISVLPRVASTLADASTLPASAIAANSAGIALSRDGRHAEAVHALESSLEIEPLQDATLVNLGLVWEEIGLPVKALECYGRAIDIAPDAAAPYINMGRALDAHLGERKAAIEAMEAAIRIDPTRGDAWNVLGQLHHSQGALDEGKTPSPGPSSCAQKTPSRAQHGHGASRRRAL